MKTAISLPDETFERVTRRAADLGISRSEFLAKAAQRYLDDLDRRSLTDEIDRAVARAGFDDSNADAAAAGLATLAAADDEW